MERRVVSEVQCLHVSLNPVGPSTSIYPFIQWMQKCM
jgi:hypothetical protein